MPNHISAVAAGMDLARRAVLGSCEDGDAGVLAAVNAAESMLELGYATAYLVDLMRKLAAVYTEDKPFGTNEFLRRLFAEPDEHTVLHNQIRLLEDGGSL